MLRRICAAPGCSRLTEHNSKYCGLHQYLQERDDRKRQEYFASANPSQWPHLYNSKEWKTLQAQQLRLEPICQKCGEAKATEVHHIQPHRGDINLFLDPNNLVSLCHNCHSAETRKEVLQRQRERNEEYQRRKRTGKIWY